MFHGVGERPSGQNSEVLLDCVSQLQLNESEPCVRGRACSAGSLLLVTVSHMLASTGYMERVLAVKTRAVLCCSQENLFGVQRFLRGF